MAINNVLIADDQLYIQVFVGRVFKKEFNFNIYKASNGIEALIIYDKVKPDIIFLDISMPQMNGLEFLKELRIVRNDKTTPVVIMTANRNSQLFNSILQLGITGYLLKPFTYASLKEHMTEILDKIT
jgi:DNA-binding NarL/FixJ family response regulator